MYSHLLGDSLETCVASVCPSTDEEKPAIVANSHKGESLSLHIASAGDRHDQYSNLDPEQIQRILLDLQAML